MHPVVGMSPSRYKDLCNQLRLLKPRGDMFTFNALQEFWNMIKSQTQLPRGS